MRTHADAMPSSTVVIGGSDHDAHLTALDHDSHGVSRVYRMTIDGTARRWEQRDPDFHQRFVGTINPSGDRIHGRWEAADPGEPWTHDFDLTYEREA